MSKFAIIDPPVSPYSPVPEIEAWIRELEGMPPSESRDQCLAEAREWLARHPGNLKNNK